MSAKATFWAWHKKGLGSSAKLVLLCLADCHNSSTNRCDPSAKYISEQTELNIKTIPNALKKLAQAGHLLIENRAGRTPNYRLNIPQNWDTPKTGTPKNGIPQKRGDTLPNIGVGGTPKTGNEPISNLQVTYKNIYKGLSLDSLPDEIDQETAKEFIDHRKNLKKPLTQKALDRTIAKAVKAATDPEINYTPTQIIEKVIDSGWQSFELHYLKNKGPKPKVGKFALDGIQYESGDL